MDLLKEIGVDADAEKNGRWVSIFGDQVQVKVARFGNPNYVKLYKQIIDRDQLTQKLREDKLTDEEHENLILELYSQTILLDWKNIEMDGKEFVYSKENCRKLLGDNRLREFRAKILEESQAGAKWKLQIDAENQDILKKN